MDQDHDHAPKSPLLPNMRQQINAYSRGKKLVTVLKKGNRGECRIIQA